LGEILAPSRAHALPRCDPTGTVLLSVFVIALVVRVAFVLLYPRPLLSDELDYDQLGWTLAKTGRFEVDGHPTAYHLPGYPAFIAATYAVFGRSPTALKIVQGVLDSFTALLLSLLVAKRYPRAALGMGVFWSLFPAAILFSSQVFSETVFVFALIGLATFVSNAPRISSPAACALGIVLGGLTLIRPVAGLLIPTVPFLFHPRPARVRALLVSFACLPLLLWTLRNALVMHRPGLTTLVGANLLIANHPGATGRYGVGSLPEVKARDEAASDSANVAAAIRYIRDDPKSFLARGAKKLLLLFTSEGELAVGHFSPSAGDASARYLEKLRAVPLWLHLLVSLPTAVVLVLGSFGLATRANDSSEKIFVALAVATAVSVIAFIGSSRYRFPLIPFLALFSAELLAAGRSRFAGPRWPRIALACSATVLVALVWAAEFHMVHGQSR
jgi:hypothetical protein